MEELERAIDTFREKNVEMPHAMYVDPITLVNTHLKELEICGIPVKVSTLCGIGKFYLLTKDEAEELEACEEGKDVKRNQAKTKRTPLGADSCRSPRPANGIRANSISLNDK